MFHINRIYCWIKSRSEDCQRSKRWADRDGWKNEKIEGRVRAQTCRKDQT